MVGVDGSNPSRQALRWALREAAERHLTVEAVQVWHYPPLTYAPGIMAAPVFAREDLEADAKAVLDEAVDAILGESGVAREVGRVVVEGSAVERLVELSQDADLLVVGHRGRGGFRELLLGSVAHQCTAHASCPVVVVR